MSWLQCRVCDWFGYQQLSKPTELRTLHRYEGAEARCPWCGEDDFVYEVATPITEHHGRSGRWVNDICLACGRVGVWFRKEPATGAG
ncbi:hypothetical protein ACFVHB_02685 [Kitasatospora sp. NPDC127111]|uniref:hypothetical protein n=1 Tax=Kitasatospora sp. NPDC127111 TaxID=3345363 RepID=UPI0036437545